MKARDRKRLSSTASEVINSTALAKAAKTTDSFLVKQASKVMPEKYAKGIVRGGLPVLVAGGLVASAYSGPVVVAGVCVKSGSLCTATLATNAAILSTKVIDVADTVILAEAGYQLLKNTEVEQTPEPTPVV